MKSATHCPLIAGAIATLALAGAAVAEPASPPNYPIKPIRLISPSPPGSPPDIVARIVAEPLTAALGQPIVVDNRPGAVGTIGMTAVAKAAPDGHTLGIMTLLHMVAPGMLQQMPYDTSRDLAPVSQLTWTATILVVRPTSPLNSVSDLVARAKTKPGQVSYASAGNGTPSHLASELFKRYAGVDILHVPFKGIAPGITAIIGEQVDMAFAGSATVTPFIKSGRLRALGTAAPQRLAAFPDLATVAELGFPGFEVREWHGMVAPAGTPARIRSFLAKEIARSVSLREVASRLSAVGLHPTETFGPDSFSAHMRSELARWTKVVREAGIRAN